MNRLEEIEARLNAIESLLGIHSEIIERKGQSFWDPSACGEQVTEDHRVVVYRCSKDHQHDTILEAKACEETK